MDIVRRRTRDHLCTVSGLLVPVAPLPFWPVARLWRTGPARFWLGLALSGGIGLLAYRRRSLSRDGVFGAIATGTSITTGGGWSWGLSLIYFFLSSSFLSHFRASDKADTAADKFSKGSERDLAQVAANGGVSALYALAAGVAPSSAARAALEAGYVGALATATADTWATELGVLSPAAPRLITTGRRVARGISGGITPLGSVSAALGALTLGLVHWLARKPGRASAHLPLLATAGGLAGSFCDSLLGATLQIMYFCPACQCETERELHACGTPTLPLRGQPWCNNDSVNLLSTLFGSLVSLGLHLLWPRPAALQKKTMPGPEL